MRFRSGRWLVFALLSGLVTAPALLAAPGAGAAPSADDRCGVDLDATQITQAITTLRLPFPGEDVLWDRAPFGGNFDPCASLSTALVTVERATGSSPVHALFFHRGQYLGTATWTAYPFTSLNAAQTTDDTVVLDYKDGREACTACRAPVYSVRYWWTGGHVEMMDPPPPNP